MVVFYKGGVVCVGAMILIDPNEERAHILVSLRETHLRPDVLVVRPPLFPFPPPGGPR